MQAVSKKTFARTILFLKLQLLAVSLFDLLRFFLQTCSISFPAKKFWDVWRDLPKEIGLYQLGSNNDAEACHLPFTAWEGAKL